MLNKFLMGTTPFREAYLLCKQKNKNRCANIGKWMLLYIATFAFLIPVQANAQLLYLSEKNTSAIELFNKIEKQTGYHFWYEDKMLDNLKPMTVNAAGEQLEVVLKRSFNDLPITWSVVGKTIVLKAKPVSAHKSEPSPVQKIGKTNVSLVDVSGKVTNKEGEPLAGITVTVKGAKGKATSTDVKGTFLLNGIAEHAVLVFSGIGYQQQEIVLEGKKYIEVVMDLEAVKIEEVVVTGYQNVDRKLFTGSSSKVLAKDAERPGVPDVSRMLEGQVAGVSVQNVSGTFGAAPKIRVRGATSISGDNKPLWVVDGIILEDVVNISNEQLSTGDANTLIGSSVAGLNPDDIESFTILKDAAATAMYGARAMNGVIVVTTKKGKASAGQPQLSYTSNWTSYLKPRYSDYNIMNSADQVALYMELEEKGYVNHADIVSAANWGVFGKMYDMFYEVDPVTGDFGLKQTTEDRAKYLKDAALRNTDWFDVLFKNSLLQEHSLSLSSGSEKSQVYASTSFLNDNGWTIADRVKRYTGNIRGTFKVSPSIQVELLGTGSIRDQMSPGTQDRLTNVVSGEYERDFDNNPFTYVMNTSRALAAYDENGEYMYYQKNYAPYSILNELNNNTLQTTSVDYKMQAKFDWKILSSLKYSFDGAYRYVKTKQEHRVKESSNAAEAYRAGTEYGVKGLNSHVAENNRFLWVDPDNPTALPVSVLPYGGFYRTNETYLVNYYMRNSLDWTKRFEKHNIDIFGLSEIRYIDRQDSWSEGVGYQYDKGGVPYYDPNYFKFLSLRNDNYYGVGYEWERYLAFMLRGAYSFDEKYNINATIRYDGSNKLGTSRVARWLPTWNVSGAWNIDREIFFRGIEQWMSQARVRATYGLVASMGPATNSAVVYYNTNTERPFFDDRENVIEISSLENSELTWEKQYEANLGFDLGFIDNRILLTVDLYNRKGFDLIGRFRTSGIDGQSSKYANYADMKSRGIEVSLQYNIISRNGWRWNVRGNIANHISEVTNLENNPRVWDLVREQGGSLVGYPVRGLFSIPFRELSSSGLPLFTNTSGGISTDVNMQSTTIDNLVYSGSIDPKLTGGFFNSISYKSLTLGALFTFSAGNVVRLAPAFKSKYSDLDASNNALLARWIIYGDEEYTTAPVVVGKTGASGISGYPFNNYNYSDVRIAKGDFIRLKQVMLSYMMPSNFVKHFWAKTASVSFVANNLWLLYSDKALHGQDPEFFESGGVSLPIQRQLSLSFKFGF